MNEGNSEPVRVFISYSHANYRDAKDLRDHLGWLQNSDQIVVFDDTQIVAGDDWDNVIRGELDRADIILLVVTAAFTRSVYCTRTELRKALELRSSRGARVIPIIAEHVDLEAMPIQSIAALPKDPKNNNLKPLNKWGRNRDEALTQVAKNVRKNVKRIKNPPPIAGSFTFRIEGLDVPGVQVDLPTEDDDLLDDFSDLEGMKDGRLPRLRGRRSVRPVGQPENFRITKIDFSWPQSGSLQARITLGNVGPGTGTAPAYCWTSIARKEPLTPEEEDLLVSTSIEALPAIPEGTQFAPTDGMVFEAALTSITKPEYDAVLAKEAHMYLFVVIAYRDDATPAGKRKITETCHHYHGSLTEKYWCHGHNRTYISD